MMCHWAVQRKHKQQQQSHTIHNPAQQCQALVSPTSSLFRAEEKFPGHFAAGVRPTMVLATTPPGQLSFTHGEGEGVAYKDRAQQPPHPRVRPTMVVVGGGFGMTPWCVDLVCSWRRLLADRHSLPFPWTLSLHRRWCPSASHHPLTFLFLLALTFPLPSPFPSLGLSLCGPQCPSASPHSFPSLSLGRLCQRSPRTCPVSLLCVESTQKKVDAFAVGQVRGGGGHGWGLQVRAQITLRR